jgi:hypothetical protein
MRAGWHPFHCPISVSSSFSTFLCFAASWTGVDKKYSHYLCRTVPNVSETFFFSYTGENRNETEKDSEGGDDGLSQASKG